MIKIYSKYDNPFEGKIRGQVPDPDCPCLVDDVGFVSMESQIRGLINAGVNLEKFRRSQLDYQYSDVPEDGNFEVSPENNPDFMPSVDMPAITESLFQNASSATSERSDEVKNGVNDKVISSESSSNTSLERSEGTSELLSS